MSKKKDPAVNALAREGGLARARTLTPQQRREIAQKAAQARWERQRREEGAATATLPSHLEPQAESVEIIANVELEAYRAIWKKVQNHTNDPKCPCDRCVDSVLSETRNRYITLLAKIDNDQKLDQDESALFRLLTGQKANRWTRIFRSECNTSKLRQ